MVDFMQILNQNDINTVLIKGNVYNYDYVPVENAIVILEKIVLEFNEETNHEESYLTYQAHTLTNQNGEFAFFITDKSSGYKVKIFDNKHG